VVLEEPVDAGGVAQPPAVDHAVAWRCSAARAAAATQSVRPSARPATHEPDDREPVPVGQHLVVDAGLRARVAPGTQRLAHLAPLGGEGERVEALRARRTRRAGRARG
jgi:hypothetical protein